MKSISRLFLFLAFIVNYSVFSQSTCASPYNMGTIGTGSTCTSFVAPGTTGSAPCAGSGYGGSGGVTYVKFCTGSSVQCINFNIQQGTASGNWAVTVYSANCSTVMDAACLGNSGTGATYNTASPSTNTFAPNSCYIARIWNANTGSFSLCAQAMSPPNDLCTSPTSISPTPTLVNNFCMTAGSAGDPGPAAFCAGSLENNAWYSITTLSTCVSPCSVVITIANIVCSGGGAGFQIGFFTGTCGSLTNIGCTSGSGGTVTATINNLSPNQTVLIGLDGNAGANCTYSMSASNTVPVPIELVDFEVTKNPGYVSLNWATATEYDDDYYTVEKTRDGTNFETVGIVDAIGNSNKTNHYSYSDKNPYYGISYYRLKQTDFDGTFTYSQMRAVDYASDTQINFNIAPNPSGSDGFNIALSHSSDELFEVLIADVTGKVIYNNYIQPDSVRLNINEGLVAGIYTVMVRSVRKDVPVATRKLVITE